MRHLAFAVRDRVERTFVAYFRLPLCIGKIPCMIELRLECLCDPVADLGRGLFGRSTATFGRSLGTNVGSVGLNSIYQTGGPRTIQLSVKLLF
jgi:hypothetical protein